MHAKSSKKGVVTAVIIILLVAVIALLAVLLLNRSKPVTDEPSSATSQTGGTGRIGYASSGVTALDEQSVQEAVSRADALAAEGGIALEYKNDAISTNGIDFDCYIGNSVENKYDMFIDIYADEEMTDEVFLSELIRPSQAFEHITLNRQFPLGDYKFNVVMSQVETVNGEQVIHAQTVITMDFSVVEPVE